MPENRWVPFCLLLAAFTLLLAGCSSTPDDDPVLVSSSPTASPMTAAEVSAGPDPTAIPAPSGQANPDPAIPTPSASAAEPANSGVSAVPPSPAAGAGDSGELGGSTSTFTMPALVGMRVNEVEASARVGVIRYTNMGGDTVNSADGTVVCQQIPDAGVQTQEGAVVLAISNTC